MGFRHFHVLVGLNHALICFLSGQVKTDHLDPAVQSVGGSNGLSRAELPFHSGSRLP